MLKTPWFCCLILVSLAKTLWGIDCPNINSVESECFTPGFAVACGGFSQFIAPPIKHSGHVHLLKVNAEVNDTLECSRMYYSGRSLRENKNYRAAYDTIKAFIEDCSYIKGMGGIGFQEMTTDVQYMSTDNSRWIEYRGWLKSVLYLNSDLETHYCPAVEAILSTFNYIDPKRGKDVNGALAIVQFLIESEHCPLNLEDLKARYTNSRLQQYKLWQDTVKNPQLTPYDTTLPTLEELGLEILRGPEMAVKFTPNRSKTILGDLTVTNNPFDRITTLNLTLNQQAYIRFELFDELGRIVIGDGNGSVLDRGKHQFIVDGGKLNQGLYYARISTLNGEVKTLKLRHLE